jgi:hypothetical protein
VSVADLRAARSEITVDLGADRHVRVIGLEPTRSSDPWLLRLEVLSAHGRGSGANATRSQALAIVLAAAQAVGLEPHEIAAALGQSLDESAPASTTAPPWRARCGDRRRVAP